MELNAKSPPPLQVGFGGRDGVLYTMQSEWSNRLALRLDAHYRIRMIVRSWTGWAATAENADVYAAHLSQKVFPRLRGLAGHLGAYLLRRDVGGRVECLVMTMWESMQAVRRFAGDMPELPVIEPEARATLSELDATVKHYEAVLTPTGVVPPTLSAAP